jgi:hypothetical protein
LIRSFSDVVNSQEDDHDPENLSALPSDDGKGEIIKTYAVLYYNFRTP